MSAKFFSSETSMSLLEHHRQKNRLTADQWSQFAPHRQRVQNLVARHADPDAALAVLGAGNMNDLDLPQLLERFAEVWLLDCDLQAIQSGVKRHGSSESERLHLGECDVTGVFADLEDTLIPPEQMLEKLRNARPPAPRPERFDVVASTCLLSQLVDRLTCHVSADDEAFTECLDALVMNHCRLLLEWTKRTGVSVLVTDLVSSDTAAELLTATDESLPSLLADLFNEGNFFRGAHPGQLQRRFQSDVRLRADVHAVQVSEPWMWDLGPRRFAVCALTIVKKAED